MDTQGTVKNLPDRGNRRRPRVSAKNPRRGPGIHTARQPVARPATNIRKHLTVRKFPTATLQPGASSLEFNSQIMQQLRVARARRRAARRHLPHSFQKPNGSVNIDGMDNNDYHVDWNASTQLPESDEARHLTTAVRSVAVQVMEACGAVFAQTQYSVARLQKLLDIYGPVGSSTISHSIATRMETLSRVQDLYTKAAKARDLLVTLGHYYRGLVTAASGVPNDVSTAIYAAERRGSLLEYIRYLIKDLAAEISANTRDISWIRTLETVPGFDAALLQNRLSTFDNIMGIAFPQIKIASGKLHRLLLSEADGEGLGHLHLKQSSWRSPLGESLKTLRHLRVWHRSEMLSRPYSASTKTLSAVDARVSELCTRLGTIELDVYINLLMRDLDNRAAMVERVRTLEPFSDSIRKEMADWMHARYHKDYRSEWRQGASIMKLQRWGYLPSPWCKKPWAGTEKAFPQSVRSKRRSRRQAYLKELFSRFRDTYHWTRSGSAKQWADTIDPRSVWIEEPVRTINSRTRKTRRIVRTRRKLENERGMVLKNTRRLLSPTLLSYQPRTLKSWRSVDRLASLPEKEKPSSLTQVGKTIAALGFYDKVDTKGANWPRKMEPLRKDSGESIVRWSYSKPKPRGVLSQLGPRFQATQSMRALHPTSTFFSSDAWEQSVEVVTNLDTNGRRSLRDESSVTSRSGGTSGDLANKKYPRSDSSGEQKPEHPNNPPDGQSPQLPNESMEKVTNDDPPHESEQEEESDSEVNEDSDAEEPEEEHTPLTYQIPSDVLESALQAPPQTRASYWSQKLYRGPEDEELLLHYCVNMEVSERVAKHFLNEKVVGFDIEWKPFGPVDSIKENASLIQLATEDRIALFHIARFPGKTPEQLMPPTLKAVLESPDTYKVGVAVKSDCSRLEKYFDLNIRGVFELSRLHNLVEYYGTQPSKVNNKLVKLATQVHQHLLLPLHKGEPFVDEPQQRLSSVRESDWSRPLDFEQIHYAAADAYAGFRLFDVMESKRKKLKPTPPMPRLCDFDNKPVPRTTSRAKRAKKVVPELEKVVAESLSGLEAEDAEEEAYETAAEEFAEEEESKDTDSEAVSESSENEDHDADYVSKEHGRVALDQRSTDASAAPEISAHRIGRVALSTLAGVDPAYPTLPCTPAEEDVSSDESDAFDPPPNAPRRRLVPRAAQAAQVLLVKAVESDDDFPDPELEEAFTTMDLSDPLKITSNPVTEPTSQAETPNLESPTEQVLIEEETPPTFTPLIPADTTNHTPEYTLATTWAQNYLTSTIPSPTSTAPSRIRATVSSLRAYHIWYHQRVPIDTIGTHLRDPPLAQSTVSNYIIQAISMEKLEYKDDELIYVMRTLPANLRVGRYGWLSRKLGIAR
ncbi:3' -5' exonuclease helicase [Paraphaeosphaeria sporulosa]